MPREWMAIEERVPGSSGQLPRADGRPKHAPCRLVQAIIATRAKNPRAPAWLVAPTRRVAQQWIDQIALAGTPVFNLRGTTPQALAYDLAAETLATQGRRTASPRATLVLLERVIVEADRTGLLRAFARPRSYRRLAETMLGSISSLRMAGLSSAAIRKRPGFGETDKAHDLACILDGYTKALDEADLVDAADVTRIAMANVAAGVMSPEWDRILVPESIDLTPLERDLFERLGTRVHSLAIDPEPTSLGTSPDTPSCHFFRAIGEVNEIRGVLRRCLARGIPLDSVELLHADEATYPPLIHEVLASLTQPLPDDAAPGHDLPVTFADGLPIRESRPARALAGWLAWQAEGQPQWRLVRMLRDGLFDVRTSHIDAPAHGDDPDASSEGTNEARLLRELRRLRTGFGVNRLTQALRTTITSVEALPLEAFITGSRDPDADPEFDPPLATTKKARRLAALGQLAVLADKLEDCDPGPSATPSSIVSKARQFIETLAATTSQFDTYARNILVAELADMERWLAKHPEADPQETLDWLASLADSLVVLGSAPRPGCLHVASISGGGHSGRPVTFIVGLDETRFPGPAATDPVLPDADRVALSDDLELAAARASQSRRDFWRLLGRLRGDLFCSYSCRDLVQQSEVFPSPVLLDVYRRHTGNATATLATFDEEVARTTESFVSLHADQALTDSEWWLAALGEAPAMPAVRQAIEAHGPRLTRGLEAEEARRSSSFTPWDSFVPEAGPSLDPTNPRGRVASAHALESLGACPRRFFFSYGLGVEPPEILEPEADEWLDPMEQGSVLHTVLERFMRRFVVPTGTTPHGEPAPSFAHHETDILTILENVLAEARSQKPSHDETAIEACRRELTDMLRTFLKSEEAYCAETGSRPVALEASIGFQLAEAVGPFDSASPATLPLADGATLRLRGRVDRIDMDGRSGIDQGYVVIDYKKGRSSRFKQSGNDPLAVFHGGRRLQHGLYVMMVRHVARNTVAESSSVTQFAYVFPGSHTHGERVTWAAHELAAVDTLVTKLCRIAGAGAFLPTNEPSDCSYCDFLEVCGDPAKTSKLASRKLEGDEGTYGPDACSLHDLFAGIREPKKTRPEGTVSRREPAAFDRGPERPPDGIGDAEARRTIREALDTTLLVEASAGTGKTTCMVDRMTALVRTGTASVNQIAAITFTKKAAAELARRFRERLERDSADTGVADMERRRLTRALDEIDSAVIGTVHSFCGRLLRERPIEAGIDPGFETMDGTAESLLRGRAWHEFLDTSLREPKLVAIRTSLEATGIEIRDLRPAFDTFVNHGDVHAWPHDPVAPPDIRGLMATISDEINDQLRGALVPWSERGSDELMNTLEAAARAYQTRHDDSPPALFRVASFFDRRCPNIIQKLWMPGGSASEKKARAQALEAWWDSAVARLREPLRQWRACRYQFVIPLLTAARAHYERLRIASGMLSFHDLLDRTARLLRERPDVRVGFAKRYPFLLVDEFQDTDPLQAEILLLLAADDPEATDWRATTIKPASLFVVGDPKQSIYRFRRADIDTFEFVKDRITASGGAVLHLNTNFRTTPDLVAWVNDQFATRFDEHRPAGAERYGPGFTPSQAGRGTDRAGTLQGLRQLRVSGKSVRAEAEAVATFIRRAIDAKLPIPRTGSGIDPACRPEDFMIVTWDTGKLSTYAEALEAVGLPCDVTGRKGPDSREDLQHLKLCLEVVADPDDTVAALALLRGPVFGFSDADLYAFHAAGGTIDGRLRVPAGLASADPTLAHRMSDAAETFRLWRRLAGSLPLVAAIEQIVRDAGLLLVASAADGRAGRRGRARAGTITTFIERVRAERAMLTSVQDVVDRIDDLVADGFPKQDFDTVSIDAKAAGAVRVMNLHKVKGLEAPVVFLCDTDGPKRDRTPSWHVSRAGGEARGFLKVASEGVFGRDGGTLAAPANWHEAEATEKRYLEAEYLRLNYVAGTRPGTCLVVSVFEDSKGEASGGWRELSPDIVGVATLPELPPNEAAERARAEAAAKAIGNAAAVATAHEARVTALAAIRRPTYGTVTPRDFLTEPAEALKYSGRGLGQEWGTVIHRLLELAGRGIASREALEAAATSGLATTSLTECGLDRAELVQRALDLVQDIQRSDVWQRIETSRVHDVEVPFVIAVDSAAVPSEVTVDLGPSDAVVTDSPPHIPVLIRGQIDAVYKENPDVAAPPPGMTDWMIVDWKTTSVTEAGAAALEAHYRPQVDLYARAWSAGLESASA